jgi:hypothetical protein
MKTKFAGKKRKFLRTILGTLSFSTALFIFQACYGTPDDLRMDILFEGVVKSKTTDLPITGIKVSIVNQPQTDITDITGSFQIYTSKEAEYTFRFEDVDANENGSFLTKDTLITFQGHSNILNVKLDVK